MRKDCDYSILIFDEVYCSEHVPDKDVRGNSTKSLKRKKRLL